MVLYTTWILSSRMPLLDLSLLFQHTSLPGIQRHIKCMLENFLDINSINILPLITRSNTIISVISCKLKLLLKMYMNSPYYLHLLMLTAWKFTILEICLNQNLYHHATSDKTNMSIDYFYSIFVQIIYLPVNSYKYYHYCMKKMFIYSNIIELDTTKATDLDYIPPTVLS